jgi:protein SCO1/2
MNMAYLYFSIFPLRLSVFACAFLLVLSGCKKTVEKKVTDYASFPLKGVVVRLDRVKKRVMIAHHEIPNYMAAMTMPFRVKDSTLLDVAQPGDSITATLMVSRTESWIEGLRVIGQGEEISQQQAVDAMFKRLFKPGDALPDLALTNQENKPIRFSDFKGCAVAVTLVYTRCPIPEFCIRMSQQFAAIQRSLKREAALNETWHLVTATFDVQHDTPKILKEYGKGYAADFSVWDFVTMSAHDLQTLLDGLDMLATPGEGGLIDHTLRTILIDKNGNVARIIKGNEWTSEEIVAEMRILAEK